MSRVTIDLPESFPFSTELDVYIGLINRGDHLGNDALLALLNEARLRYMQWAQQNAPAMQVTGIINADLAIIYKSEGKYGDRLRFDVAPANFSAYGCDFIFKVTHATTHKEVARAKMAMLQYDYQLNKLVPVPDDFENWLQGTS